MSLAAQRLQGVRENIARAAGKAGRDPGAVRLIAVSKRHSVESIKALLDLGMRDFGESQIQEAQQKIPAFSGLPLNWHLVGHLQSNKTREVPGLFSHVHSVDSLKLVRRIAASAMDIERPVQLLLQVNIAGDPAKYGLRPEAVVPLIDTVLSEEHMGVELCGLMTIGFRDAGEVMTRRGFADLRELLETCRSQFGETFSELSMGMSGDYALAIEEGATMVRVGSALFGERL
jgi:pyridoxal phosphate enzyme (YggS family)